MRWLIAIAIGFAFVIGMQHASSSAAPTPPTEQLSCPAATDDGDAYICLYSPRCQRASQCEAYCAGGIPLCVQGCCSCAS